METIREKLRNSRSIAVVRTDKLGDMVLTLPMVNALKEFCPNSHIDFIASSYTEVLLHGQNLINNYHFIDKTHGGINQIFSSNTYDAVFFPRPRFDEIFSAFRIHFARNSVSSPIFKSVSNTTSCVTARR